MATTLYQESINNYLAEIYRSQPMGNEIIKIRSQSYRLNYPGKFTFPKMINLGETSTANIKNTYYFIRDISITGLDDLDPKTKNGISIQLICAGQIWISGQLGLLDRQTIKDAIIPIPDPEIGQEIELIISYNGHTEWNSLAETPRIRINYNVVAVNNFRGDGIPICRQVICPVPANGIIQVASNILAYRPNCYTRLNIYIPNEITLEPVIIIKNLDNKDDETHNQVIQPRQKICQLGYKIWQFDANRITLNTMVKLVAPSSEELKLNDFKYSFIENQVARIKNGYIGLAF